MLRLLKNLPILQFISFVKFKITGYSNQSITIQKSCTISPRIPIFLISLSKPYPIIHDLFNVVYDTKQIPLNIHFVFSPHGKPIQPFLCPDIRKDRLHNSQPPFISCLSLLCIDLLDHLTDQRARGSAQINF